MATNIRKKAPPPTRRVAASARRGAVRTTQLRDESYVKVFAFLGQVKGLGRRYSDLVAQGAGSVELHEFLAKGLPGEALVALVRKVRSIDPIDVGNAVGVSVRTLQRKSHAPDALLSKEQSGKTWKFAEILSKATDVLGSQPEAERWLIAPAIALNQRRPIDLLGTPVGVELVEQLLGRIEYGVYT